MVRTSTISLSVRGAVAPTVGLALALGTLAPARAQSPGASPVPGAEAPGTAAAPAASDSLPALLAEALANNPELKAARLEAEAARAEGRAAAALPPPQAGVEFFQAPVSGFPDPISDQAEIDWFVQQTFPFPGKRAALRAPALRMAEAAEARARELELRVAREVKEAFYDLYLLEARRRINADNQALLRRFVEIARKQYEVGMGAQADILMAHSELAAQAGEALDLDEEREAALGRLNALLARDPERAFDPPETLQPRVQPLTLPAVLGVARRRHPGLAIRAAEAEARAAEARAARREGLPNLMVRGVYKDMREPPPHGGPMEDAWAVMLAVDLPLAPWAAGRSRGGYRAAEARAGQARLGREAEENRLAAELRAALARHKAAGERLDLARAAMVPHAEQALQGLQAAYTAGKAEFMDLLAAYRMAIAARRDEQEAVVKVMRSRADLEAAAGADYGELAAASSGGGGAAGQAPGRREGP